jgi:uncharacterized damage-inducible protein DinB
MHARTTEIFACLDAQMADFRAAVETVPAAKRGVRPSPERWSVAETIEHVALTERLITKACTKQLAAARDAGLAIETETSSVLSSLPIEAVASRENRLSAPERLVPTGIDADAALRDLETARAAFRELVTSCDGLALGQVSFPHPSLGPLNMYQWLLFVAGHQARHAAQIRELADQL